MNVKFEGTWKEVVVAYQINGLEKTRKDLRTVDVPNESGTESFECVIV
jgi:hypothetical protein